MLLQHNSKLMCQPREQKFLFSKSSATAEEMRFRRCHCLELMLKMRSRTRARLVFFLQKSAALTRFAATRLTTEQFYLITNFSINIRFERASVVRGFRVASF